MAKAKKKLKQLTAKRLSLHEELALIAKRLASIAETIAAQAAAEVAPVAAPVAIKTEKKRGRPPKVKVVTSVSQAKPAAAVATAPRKRGRPAKAR